ncbi:uncharacterized protein LOC128371762 [Scomber japonicus]|uniref:uncharacterized protein LOC128371762 n=1 Tax=Scomber japonicus TaxID=13676 RepID=UPI002306C5BA|nr:uncharacterized protein LOC128371762 [Scomber japonicus]
MIRSVTLIRGTIRTGESGGLTGNDVTQTEIQSEILGVKSTSDQTNITPDIWAELKELRDMTRVELRKLEQENTDMMARLKISENEVEELKRQNADQPKVAFSLGLTDSGHIGPFDTDIILKFSKVFINFGQGYSPSTGLFTAPVRGAYYFSLNLLDTRRSPMNPTEARKARSGKEFVRFLGQLALRPAGRRSRSDQLTKPPNRSSLRHIGGAPTSTLLAAFNT